MKLMQKRVKLFLFLGNFLFGSFALSEVSIKPYNQISPEVEYIIKEVAEQFKDGASTADSNSEVLGGLLYFLEQLSLLGDYVITSEEVSSILDLVEKRIGRQVFKRIREPLGKIDHFLMGTKSGKSFFKVFTSEGADLIYPIVFKSKESFFKEIESLRIHNESVFIFNPVVDSIAKSKLIKWSTKKDKLFYQSFLEKELQNDLRKFLSSGEDNNKIIKLEMTGVSTDVQVNAFFDKRNLKAKTAYLLPIPKFKESKPFSGFLIDLTSPLIQIKIPLK